MCRHRSSRLAFALVAAALALGVVWTPAPFAQGKKLKIGVVYDYTGPFAGGGSELHALGAKIMIDYFIKKGGVEAIRSRRSTPTPRASPTSPSTKRCA